METSQSRRTGLGEMSSRGRKQRKAQVREEKEAYTNKTSTQRWFKFGPRSQKQHHHRRRIRESQDDTMTNTATATFPTLPPQSHIQFPWQYHQPIIHYFSVLSVQHLLHDPTFVESCCFSEREEVTFSLVAETLSILVNSCWLVNEHITQAG